MIKRSNDQLINTGTQDNQNYNVFMILTDGIIDDVDITIQSIIRASHTPLSIIIVGIGNEDFSDMSVLDADGEILEAGTYVGRSFRDRGRREGGTWL